jgi:Flp pilus assembly protein TadB
VSLALAGAIAAATAAVAVVLAAASRDAPPVPLRLAHPDADALREAGWAGGLRRWEAMRAALVVGVASVALMVGAPPAIAVVAAFGPTVWIRERAEAARDRARRSFGRILATTESALRAGLSLPEAIRRAIEAADEPLAARPLEDALRAFDLGASLDAALSSVARGCPERRARVAMASLALGIAERLPRERMADLVGAVADRTAFEDRLDEEVRARAAGARQQQRLLAAVVPALALYLSVTMPMLSAALASDLGRFVLIPAAVALEIGGIVLSGRAIRAVIR